MLLKIHRKKKDKKIDTIKKLMKDIIWMNKISVISLVQLMNLTSSSLKKIIYLKINYTSMIVYIETY